MMLYLFVLARLFVAAQFLNATLYRRRHRTADAESRSVAIGRRDHGRDHHPETGAAHDVVRQVGAGRDNPPEKVELVRYRAFIPPPGRRGLVRYDFEPPEWERQPILTCHFDAAGGVTRIESPATAPSPSPATAPADEPAAGSP